MELKEFLEEVKKELPNTPLKGGGICHAIIIVGNAKAVEDSLKIREVKILEELAGQLMRHEKVRQRLWKMTGFNGVICGFWFGRFDLDSRLEILDYMISICEDGSEGKGV